MDNETPIDEPSTGIHVVAAIVPLIGVILAIVWYARNRASAGTALLLMSILGWVVWVAMWYAAFEYRPTQTPMVKIDKAAEAKATLAIADSACDDAIAAADSDPYDGKLDSSDDLPACQRADRLRAKLGY